MTPLRPGDKAPAFHLQDQNGNGWGLGDFAGHWLVVYFYPEDDTPGCTKQACGFRDTHAANEEANIKVVGVSQDDVASHSRFVDKYDLPFTLLADPTYEMIEAYGVKGTYEWQGETHVGATRVTFLIDPDGVIQNVYSGMDLSAHAQGILEDVQGLKAAA